MSEYTDNDVPIECGCCSEFRDGIPAMINHILEKHGNEYTPEESTNFAGIWADDAYERIEAENAYRANYFSRYGEDPYEPRSDQDYGD